MPRNPQPANLDIEDEEEDEEFSDVDDEDFATALASRSDGDRDDINEVTAPLDDLPINSTKEDHQQVHHILNLSLLIDRFFQRNVVLDLKLQASVKIIRRLVVENNKYKGSPSTTTSVSKPLPKGTPQRLAKYYPTIVDRAQQYLHHYSILPPADAAFATPLTDRPDVNTLDPQRCLNPGVAAAACRAELYDLFAEQVEIRGLIGRVAWIKKTVSIITSNVPRLMLWLVHQGILCGAITRPL